MLVQNSCKSITVLVLDLKGIHVSTSLYEQSGQGSIWNV